MRGKLLFVTGLGIGYLLGSRAGRKRYEQIKAGAEKIWQSAPIQAGVARVQDCANQRVDVMQSKMTRKAKKVVGSLLGSDDSDKAASKPAVKRPPAKRPATKVPATAESTKAESTKAESTK